MDAGHVPRYAHIDWMANLVRHAVPTVQKIAGLADSGFYPGTLLAVVVVVCAGGIFQPLHTSCIGCTATFRHCSR